MSNQTIDEILNSYVPATDYSDKRESDPTDRERAKAAIQKLIGEVIMEDEQSHIGKKYYIQRALNSNELRAEQRQRAKERGLL